MPKPFGAAARTVRDGFVETLAYTEFPPEHWRQISMNNGIERINRKIRRRTRIAGTFPDGNSALMLVTARLKYIVEHEWGNRRYLDMSKLEEMDRPKGKTEGQKRTRLRPVKSICERFLTAPQPVLFNSPSEKSVKKAQQKPQCRPLSLACTRGQGRHCLYYLCSKRAAS